MTPYRVTVYGHKPITIHATTALEAVIAVLNRFGLRYKDTNFHVRDVVR